MNLRPSGYEADLANISRLLFDDLEPLPISKSYFGHNEPERVTKQFGADFRRHTILEGATESAATWSTTKATIRTPGRSSRRAGRSPCGSKHCASQSFGESCKRGCWGLAGLQLHPASFACWTGLERGPLSQTDVFGFTTSRYYKPLSGNSIGIYFKHSWRHLFADSRQIHCW